MQTFFIILGPAIGGILTIIVGYFLFRERLAMRLGLMPTREDVLSFKKELIAELEKVADRLTLQMAQIRNDLLERHAEAIKRIDNHGAKIDTATTQSEITRVLTEGAMADIKTLEKRVNHLEHMDNQRGN